MMLQILTASAVWMIASIALGLIFGKVMHRYTVNERPMPVSLREKPPYQPVVWVCPERAGRQTAIG